MICPLCLDHNFGSTLGNVTCPQCNSNLMIRRHNGQTTCSTVEPVKALPSYTSRHKGFLVQGEEPEQLLDTFRCGICDHPADAIAAARGQVLQGFTPYSIIVNGQEVIKYRPNLRTVYACVTCKHKLTEVLPDLHNTVKENRGSKPSKIVRETLDNDKLDFGEPSTASLKGFEIDAKTDIPRKCKVVYSFERFGVPLK